MNAGASFGNAKTDFNVAPSTFVAFLGPAFSGTIPGFAGSDTVYPSGFMGGGQIGYNWQFSPIWVVGLEADFQGALERDSSTLTRNFSSALFLVTGQQSNLDAIGTAALDYTAKIDWFGTVRARLGYVWGNGNVMSYVTGGLAYGKVEVAGTSALTAQTINILQGPPFGPLLSVTQAIDHSNVNTGWVVGFGTEGKLLIPGWTYKIETLYMDLGHLDTSAPGGSAGVPGAATMTAGPVTTHSHFTDGILRAGLNYQFH